MKKQSLGTSNHNTVLVAVAFLLIGMLPGCTTPQMYSTIQELNITLKPGDLEEFGIAFITPSTVTGQEEDKQELAMTFANVLHADRPRIHLVTLPESLSAINAENLATIYKNMFEDYRDTGLFPRDTLQQIGKATKVRYLAQLKLAGLSQGSMNRFGIFGLRLLETKYTNIRLVLQIWDSKNGSIAWEGVEELNYAYDTMHEKMITLKTVVEATAHNLISRLP